MLRFFRKMRNALIPESRFGRYFFYALGEIVLVVIGILIALQVNNWNQLRKDAQREQVALVNLKLDFATNQQNLADLIIESDSVILDNLMVLKNTGKNYQLNSYFKLDRFVGSLAHTPKFYPKNSSLDDLLNSGNLGILKSDVLRKLLTSWNPTIEYLKTREESCEQVDEKIEDFITKYGSWLNYDISAGSFEFPLPSSGFETDNNNLLQRPEFENHVDNHIYQLTSVKNRQKETLKLAEQIMQVIDNELKK